MWKRVETSGCSAKGMHKTINKWRFFKQCFGKFPTLQWKKSQFLVSFYLRKLNFVAESINNIMQWNTIGLCDLKKKMTSWEVMFWKNVV